MLELKFIQKFLITINNEWLKGWTERNGGNMSYRMSGDEIKEAAPYADMSAPFSPIGISVPDLANEWFVITGSGKYSMNTLREPENNIAIIRLDDKGENYSIVWGLCDGGRPTSELPTHMLNHSIKKQTTGGKNRVVLHAHPANIIALTFLLPLDDKVFTREIWGMITECPVVFPAGIGVLPWMVCGSSDIAVATGEKIKQYDAVIWSHHGIFCTGDSFDSAFGLMDTIEKAAEILIKVMSCGGKKRDITPEQILALEEPFNISVNKEPLM